MKYRMKLSTNKGFAALVAVVLLSVGLLAFSLATFGSAIDYADLVYRRELRIQAALNANSCIESLKLISAKDYFLSGSINVAKLGCVGNVARDSFGNVTLNATSSLEQINAHASANIYLPEL